MQGTFAAPLTFSARENLAPTTHPKLLLAHPRRIDAKHLYAGLDALARFSELGDAAELRDTLKELVPEYHQCEVVPNDRSGNNGGSCPSAMEQPVAPSDAAEAQMTP